MPFAITISNFIPSQYAYYTVVKSRLLQNQCFCSLLSVDRTSVLSFFFKTTLFAFQQPAETYELYRMFVDVTLLWHVLITLCLYSGILQFNMVSNSWQGLVFNREVKSFLFLNHKSLILHSGRFITSLSTSATSTGNFRFYYSPSNSIYFKLKKSFEVLTTCF